MTALWLIASLLGADTPAGPSPAAAGPTASVTLNICCFRNTAGTALVALFDSADAWLKSPGLRLERRVIAGPKLQVIFKDLPPGRYAASVLHDENDNNKMDMRWFPFPKPAEGAGVTHNEEAKFGPPSYKAAAFTLTEQPRVFDVLMRY